MTYYVFKSYAAYTTESAYGVPAAATTITSQFGYIDSVKITENNNVLRKRSIGAGRNVAGFYPGKYESKGSIDMSLTTGAPFQLALGGTPSTGASWSVAEADILPSWDLMVPYRDGTTADDKVFIWQGIKTNGFKITANRDSTECKGTMDVFGQQPAVGTTTPSFTFTSAQIYKFYQANAYWGGSTTADTQIVSWDVNIGNSLVPRVFLGSRFYGAIFEGPRNYDFNVSLNFKDLVEYSRFFDGSTTSTGPTSNSTNNYSTFEQEYKMTNGTNFIDMIFSTAIWDTITSPLASPEDSEVMTQVVGIGQSCSMTYL